MKPATKLSCHLFSISQERKLIKCDIKIVEQLVTPRSLGQTHATPKNIFFGLSGRNIKTINRNKTDEELG
jgi:hypothetical protein